MKRKLFLPLALLAAWLVLPTTVSAEWTCFYPPGTGTVCFGRSVNSTPIPYKMIEVPRAGSNDSGLGSGTYDRYYFWLGQTPPLNGVLLVSHHATVESGLGADAIRQGLVTLDDSKGVACITAQGCPNDIP
jgi:hypothetical protein